MSKLLRWGVLIDRGSTDINPALYEVARRGAPVSVCPSRPIAGSGVVERLAETMLIPPLIVLADATELRELRELRLSMFLADELAISRTLGRCFRFSFSVGGP